MQRFITHSKEILTLDVLEVGIYIIGLIVLTAVSNICANSRCFNPVYPGFEAQNKAEVAYEQGPGTARQLRHLNWIMQHDSKDIRKGE